MLIGWQETEHLPVLLIKLQTPSKQKIGHLPPEAEGDLRGAALRFNYSSLFAPSDDTDMMPWPHFKYDVVVNTVNTVYNNVNAQVVCILI